MNSAYSRSSRSGGYRTSRYEYGFDGNAARAPRRVAPEISERPRISVVPGQGNAQAEAPLPNHMYFLAKAVAVVLVVLALICGARIALTSASLSASLTSQELSSQIDTSRTEGRTLEVTQSSLSNPTRIKSEANTLGLAAPTKTKTLKLAPDVVQLDDAGNLVLPQSIRVAAGL